MPGVFYEYTQDKKEGVAGIGDDGIGQYSVGTAAGTDDPHDPDLSGRRLYVDEVDDISFIVTVDATVPLASTDGTGLHFRPEGCHVFIKKGLCGFFYSKKLAIYKILSYHSNCNLKMDCKMK